MEAGPHGMKVARRRSRMRRRDLWTCLVLFSWGRDEISERKTYIGGVGFAHDDVEDADVAAVL